MGKSTVVGRRFLAIIAGRPSKNDERRRRTLAAYVSDYRGCSEGLREMFQRQQ
jgi:hypothetical protein